MALHGVGAKGHLIVIAHVLSTVHHTQPAAPVWKYRPLSERDSSGRECLQKLVSGGGVVCSRSRLECRLCVREHSPLQFLAQLHDRRCPIRSGYAGIAASAVAIFQRCQKLSVVGKVRVPLLNK